MTTRSFGPAAATAKERRELLALRGCILDVVIHAGRGDRSPRPGFPSHLECGALVDTGASSVCVDRRLAHALGLREFGQTTVSTPAGPIAMPIYAAVLEIPQLSFKKLIQVLGGWVDRESYHVLLGRSFLSDYIVTFDGPEGVFHFYERPQGLALAEED